MADCGLPPVVLAGVGVGEIDHDAWLEAGLLHLSGGLGDAFGGVVHRLAAAAQDDVRIGIARGDQDRRLAGFGEA